MGNIMKYIITEEWRECSQCHVFKIWDCYHKSKTAKLWHCSSCISCCYVYKKSWVMTRESIENKIEWQRHRNKKHERVVEKMTTSHQYAEDKPYWDTSDMIEPWTKPHKALFLYIK